MRSFARSRTLVFALLTAFVLGGWILLSTGERSGAQSSQNVEGPPPSFDVASAELIIDENDALAISAFVKWAETPQGAEFWIAEKKRLADGGELSDKAEKALEPWIAYATARLEQGLPSIFRAQTGAGASELEKLQASEKVKDAVAKARAAMRGDADAVAFFVEQSEAEADKRFWRREVALAQRDGAVSVLARDILQGWIRTAPRI